MEKQNTKILYMGTPSISATVLEDLILDGYQIIGVVTQEDKYVGRKNILEESPVKKMANKYNIPVYQPHKIRQEYHFVEEIKPDLILTLAYGQIIPEEMLRIPPLGALNLHGSLLPKYRGASPIQTSIINGETVTGVTLMEMTKEMDAGRMYAKIEVEILPEDNTTSLFIKIGDVASKLALEYLPKYLAGELLGEEQDPNKVTFCHLIKPEDEKLTLDLSKERFVNMVRGLADEPGGYLLYNEEKLKIYKASVYSNEIIGEVGEIVKADKNGLLLQLSDGLVTLLDVQKAGKKRMDYKSFVNGNQSILHTILK